MLMECDLEEKVQNLIVDRSTACDFMLCENMAFVHENMKNRAQNLLIISPNVFFQHSTMESKNNRGCLKQISDMDSDSCIHIRNLFQAPSVIFAFHSLEFWDNIKRLNIARCLQPNCPP